VGEAAGWLLAGGTVLDGAGGTLPADVLVRGERIAAVLPRSAAALPPAVAGAQVLDCTGLYVAPGFVDAHAHDDSAAADPERYEAKIRQGVTTTIVGQDGFAWAPVPPAWRTALARYWGPVNGPPWLPDGTHLLQSDLAGYREVLKGRLGLHVAVLAGHANLRLPVAGFALRRLAAEEVGRMVVALESSLDQGACGLSTGLTYVPARAADTAELLALAERLAPRDLPYVSHLRGYGPDIFAAAAEAVDLARHTGCRVHLSHLHLAAREVWGQADRLLAQLDRARAEGCALTWDLYPYQAGSSVLSQYIVPHWQDGGPEAFLRRLAQPDAARRLAADPGFAATDWAAFVVSHTRSGRHVGRTVADLARGQPNGLAAAVVELLLQEELDVGVVVHQTLEADDDLLLLHPACAVCSDGIFARGRPHPRAWGAFARFWRRMVRERRRLSPAEAVRRMSGLAAEVHRLPGRGRVRPGAAADLVVFDGERFTDAATYEDPCRPALGVRHVLVGGVPVLRDGRFDPQVRPGVVLAPA
jgi:N-acyl-D-amino-acid deacylase